MAGGTLSERIRRLFGRGESVPVSPARVGLVIADISGYTGFLKFHGTAIEHAHEIVSQLIESVIDRAEHPLTLNKLEGDAALLYATLGDDETSAARDIARQASEFFRVFHARAADLARSRSHCPCDACRGILDLQLKAFLHAGTVAFRRIRQFEEMGGPDVIVIHRLLKNSIPEREYLLMTDPFRALAGDLLDFKGRDHEEDYADIGIVRSRIFNVK